MDELAQDPDFIRRALAEAEAAFAEGEVPVGAVLVINGEIVSAAHNTRETTLDPTAHAEVLVMREACRKIAGWRLTGATLYVTKEPCLMCAGAMINARLGRLVYGCRDIKGGAVKSLYQTLSDARLNHRVEVVPGVMEEECALLLKRFFMQRRKSLKADLV
jgi:tRNA(adenine34) deaminase